MVSMQLTYPEQSVTPAPQVEIIRNIIPDPKYFATG